MRIAIGLTLLALGLTAQAQQPMQPIGQLPIDELLTTLDRNGNGCIDLEEGRNYTSRRFHAYDANEDDIIDATELPPAPGETTNDRPITIAAWQDAYHARFDRFDTDANGCLSLEEVEAGRASLAAGGQ
jgi:Ca2+-binding EF-hand superfamily protein